MPSHRNLNVTPQMEEAGLTALCSWQEPSEPIFSIRREALAAAYIAMVRVASLPSLTSHPKEMGALRGAKTYAK